uniref:CSON008726 protein n=1 Tax=Culicoides sonorensis TaxID=179676 RepID=A0A336LZ86_CULSO
MSCIIVLSSIYIVKPSRFPRKYKNILDELNLPFLDCVTHGGNPDTKSISSYLHTENFDPIKDINFILYNPTFPHGKNISDIDQKFKRIPYKRRLDRRIPRRIFSETSLDLSLPIKFLIHGFTDSGHGPSVQSIKDAYLVNKNKNNIIIVDWEKGSGTSYFQYPFIANHRVPMVAERVAQFTQFIVQDFKFNVRNITIIGHSLGAQIAGLAGKEFKKRTGKIIFYIVGLDPALPEFKNKDKEDRLNVHDATHVQVIHTTAGCLGFDLNIGRLDFYPNYRKHTHKMPGCGADLLWHCSHSRSYQYFAESINSDIGFKAWRCDYLKALQDDYCPDKVSIKMKEGGVKNIVECGDKRG